MIEIIGVRFKANGKVYYFSPGDHQFQTGDLVVVETSKGTECCLLYTSDAADE